MSRALHHRPEDQRTVHPQEKIYDGMMPYCRRSSMTPPTCRAPPTFEPQTICCSTPRGSCRRRLRGALMSPVTYTPASLPKACKRKTCFWETNKLILNLSVRKRDNKAPKQLGGAFIHTRFNSPRWLHRPRETLYDLHPDSQLSSARGRRARGRRQPEDEGDERFIS